MSTDGSSTPCEHDPATTAADACSANQRCIADVSAASPDLRGTVAIKARVLGSGKVESVSATAPASIRESGAIPCIRKAVYDHRFPSFDGPGSAIDLHFDVE